MNAAGIITKPARALALATSLVAATSVVAFASDVTVGFGTLANDPMANAYLNPPTGLVTLGGHPFDLSSGNMIPLAGGQSASISGSHANTTAAYILINSYDTWTTYAGQPIGHITLTFSDGTTQTTTLVAGGNIREWRPTGSNTVNTATDPNLVNVWSGQAQPTAGGGTAVIDMLTIPVSGQYKTLTTITISNDRNDGPSGVGIIVPAITVNDGPAPQPICIRSGNSCGTPAAQNSQSWKWQPVLPGATNTNTNTNAATTATNPHANGGNGVGNGIGGGRGHKSQ